MNKRLVSVIKYLFFFGLGIFLVWWSLHQIPDAEWDKFKQSLASAHYWMILPVFLILSASHVFRALRWRLLMEPMGYFPSFPNTFFAVMIGYLANLAFPRLGEVLKCTMLSRYEKIPAEKIVGTIVAERAFDVLCLALLFAAALIVQFDVVTGSYQNVKTLQSQQHGSASNIKIYILGFMAVAVAGFIIWILATGRWKAMLEKIKRIIRGVWEGLITARKLKHKALFAFYTVMIWALYIGGTWLGFHGTDGTATMGLKEAVSGLAFASIGMIVTPGGIGAYAFLMAKVLEENGIEYAIGVANGTLQWFAQFLIVVIIGSACLILLPFYNKKKTDESR